MIIRKHENLIKYFSNIKSILLENYKIENLRKYYIKYRNKNFKYFKNKVKKLFNLCYLFSRF